MLKNCACFRGCCGFGVRGGTEDFAQHSNEVEVPEFNIRAFYHENTKNDYEWRGWVPADKWPSVRAYKRYQSLYNQYFWGLEDFKRKQWGQLLRLEKKAEQLWSRFVEMAWYINIFKTLKMILDQCDARRERRANRSDARAERRAMASAASRATALVEELEDVKELASSNSSRATALLESVSLAMSEGHLADESERMRARRHQSLQGQ